MRSERKKEGLDALRSVEKVSGEIIEVYVGVGYPLPTAAPPHKVKLNRGSLVRLLCGDPGFSGNFDWKPLISGHFPKTKAGAIASQVDTPPLYVSLYS
ncbi:hypothetical protein ET33_18650 [Paenibacillus tyrfis]|uniref:Uncharacterized protein n=1 Tax=Paenibacillus tyrfis TaxID=1501230 RepID=A0A081NXB0_9BACL|nr:hypothetical protein ET33_18650 [Paenibacillus tyrfis]